MAKILFWYEPGTAAAANYPLMDRFASYFGLEPVVVDAAHAFKRNAGYPIAVDSLDDALAQFSDHTWIWLHSQGETFLDEVVHPADPVIYAFGSNYTGFGKPLEELLGITVKLRNPDEIWDYQVAQMVMYDRYLHQLGKRV